jgi:hypothetical protein
LLAQPTFGERVKKNLVWMIIFFLGFVASSVMNFSMKGTDFIFMQMCLSVVVLVLLIFLLIALFRKFPLNELYLQRAERHLRLDPAQAREDYLRAFQSTQPEARFKGLLKYFLSWNQLDPDTAQLSLINLIRILPANERQSLGGKYPKTMTSLDQMFEEEAQNALIQGDPDKAARKQIYRSYFLESKVSSMFQTKETTNFLEAVMDGAQKGWQQTSYIGSINELRSQVLAGESAMTLQVCPVCRAIVDENHEPKHKKKIYPIHLVPDEVSSVRQAFQERYPPARK